MANSIHGHDVLDFMAASGAVYTRATLVAAMGARFGADARFHTCSAEDMTAEQLIEFLAAHGKFHRTEAGFTFAPENSCRHERR